MNQQAIEVNPEQQRKRAIRTIQVLAVVAFSIYVAFILHMVLAK